MKLAIRNINNGRRFVNYDFAAPYGSNWTPVQAV